MMRWWKFDENLGLVEGGREFIEFAYIKDFQRRMFEHLWSFQWACRYIHSVMNNFISSFEHAKRLHEIVWNKNLTKSVK